jgi:hypothetical protein
MRPTFSPGHSHRPSRTFLRRCLVLAVAGLGALAGPAAQGGDGPEPTRAPRGKIFATATLGARIEGVDEASSVVAIDPATRESTSVEPSPFPPSRRGDREGFRSRELPKGWVR